MGSYRFFGSLITNLRSVFRKINVKSGKSWKIYRISTLSQFKDISSSFISFSMFFNTPIANFNINKWKSCKIPGKLWNILGKCGKLSLQDRVIYRFRGFFGHWWRIRYSKRWKIFHFPGKLRKISLYKYMKLKCKEIFGKFRKILRKGKYKNLKWLCNISNVMFFESLMTYWTL